MPNPIPELQNANMGWLYYKKYYHAIDFSQPDKSPDNEAIMASINATIISSVYKGEHDDAFNRVNKIQDHLYYMETMYPGLLCGSGYTHETNRLGETKIGFFFDHITGLPCLPGHSVKGKIRSSFPQWQNDKIKYQLQKQEYIINFLRSDCKLDLNKLYDDYLLSLDVKAVPGYSDNMFIRMLENIIFEGLKPKINKQGEWETNKGHYIFETVSIYDRDIFYDAYVSNGGQYKEIIGMDSITPHEHPLRNPVPIAFIKVLPGVAWSFQFNLLNNLIDAQSKLKLFFLLLQESGIGAKTNVGYGQFNLLGFRDQEEHIKAGLPTILPVRVARPATFRNRAQ